MTDRDERAHVKFSTAGRTAKNSHSRECILFDILHMHVEKVPSTPFVAWVSIVKARITISVERSQAVGQEISVDALAVAFFRYELNGVALKE